MSGGGEGRKRRILLFLNRFCKVTLHSIDCLFLEPSVTCLEERREHCRFSSCLRRDPERPWVSLHVSWCQTVPADRPIVDTRPNSRQTGNQFYINVLWFRFCFVPYCLPLPCHLRRAKINGLSTKCSEGNRFALTYYQGTFQ